MREVSTRPLRGRGLRAQALVECAIALPVLFALLLATVNISQMFRGVMVAQQAASEAARYSTTYVANAAGTGSTSPTVTQVKDFARQSVGVSGMDVTVSTVDVVVPTYTMHVTGLDSVTRSTDAKTVRTGTRVTVKVPVTLVGIRTPFVAVASHTGISSQEGKAV